jgi:hypothetical protein
MSVRIIANKEEPLFHKGSGLESSWNRMSRIFKKCTINIVKKRFQGIFNKFPN